MKVILLDAETEREFRYKASELSATSHKPVVFQCFQCGDKTIKNRREIKGTCRPCTKILAKEKVKQTNLKRYGTISPAQNVAIKDKIKQTNLERYGVTSASCLEEVKEKIRQTSLARYGTEHASQSEAAKAKRAATNVERYGAENPFQNEDIKDKIKQTNLMKYGTTSAMQSDAIQEKARQTNMARYGAAYPLSTQEIQAKSRATMLKRYGVERPILCPEIKEKTKKTNIKRYGVTHPAMLPEVTRKGMQTRLERYGTLQPQNLGKAEKELAIWIKELGHTIDPTFLLPSNQSIDILVPDRKLAIEYCGLYWHNEFSPTPRPRDYHFGKFKETNSLGFRLITIFEDEALQHKYAVQNYLRSVLGSNARRIGARKCDVRQIDDASDFLDTHHIQGAAHTTVVFCLFYSSELVGVLSLGQHHRGPESGAVILNRLCFAADTTVQGGANKLLNAATEWATRNGYSKIVTWSDNRWSEGDVYERMGFILDREYGPDYSWVDLKRPGRRASKQSMQKSKTGCPPEQTEREWAHQNGFARIWDCGKKRWVLEL